MNLAEKAWKSYVKVGFDARAFLIGWIRHGVEYKFYRTSSPSFQCNYWWRDCISVGQPVSPNLDILEYGVDNPLIISSMDHLNYMIIIPDE